MYVFTTIRSITKYFEHDMYQASAIVNTPLAPACKVPHTWPRLSSPRPKFWFCWSEADLLLFLMLFKVQTKIRKKKNRRENTGTRQAGCEGEQVKIKVNM